MTTSFTHRAGAATLALAALLACHARTPATESPRPAASPVAAPAPTLGPLGSCTAAPASPTGHVGR